nr:hypothetical protein [Tanacetum cinerariifolium]
MNDKMNDPKCVTRKVKISPHDYSKENLLSTFTPQKQLTPKQIFWSNDLMKLKFEALKERTKVSRPIKAFTVKHDAIDRKNLLIANDNLIAECLSKKVFSVATKPELNVARFAKMHVANTFVEARCLALEAELATLEAKVVRPRDRSITYACRYTKHSQELLEYAIGTCPQGSQQRAKQLAHIPLIRKKQVTVSKPSDKISPAKGDNKLPVDDQPRKNKSHLRTSNRIDSSSCLKRTGKNTASRTKKSREQEWRCKMDWYMTGAILHKMKQLNLLSAYTLGADIERQTLNKANLEIVAYQFGLESVEAQLIVHQKNKVVYEEKIAVLEIKVKDKGYEDQLSETDSEALPSVFDSHSSDGDGNQTNDRPTANKTSASISKGEANVIKTSNISVEMPKVDSVRTSGVIIKYWDSKEKINTVRVNGVNTARQTTVSTVEGNRVTAVKASAGCVWRPKMTDLNNVSKDSSGSWTSKRGNPQQALKYKGMLDSGYSRHMTGNKALLIDYQDIDGGFVAFGGSTKGGKITGIGKIRTNKIDFEDVFFVKELKFNIFSISQMCDKKNSVLFTETECLVLSLDFKLIDESQVLLRVPKQNNMYSFDLKSVVPSGDLTCLFTKATFDKSNLWHMRLGHVNFKTINKLMKGNLVRGLPSKTFQNNHTFVACQKEKQHKASCKAKLVSSIRQPLQMLHMDLFGPTSVRSINHKTYFLVVTDDFSREMDEFCGKKGIKREYSIAKTPQQNRVVERKNVTLIEAARTMLPDSLLPTIFWAKAVNIACYVINRVLVTKPHNKTPYELIIGRPPSISFMRPFGCPVTILNTLDPLGKFNGGQGPNWIFDIDSLTNSMNCQLVTAGNQANKNTGQQEINGDTSLKKNVDVGHTEEEKVSTQQYIVFPLWSSIASSYTRSDDKAGDDTVDDAVGKKKLQELVSENDQALKNVLDRMINQEMEATEQSDAVRKEFEAQCNSQLLQEKVTRSISTNSFSIVSTPVNTVIGDPKSEVQTRGKIKKSYREHAMISYIQQKRRTNHKDFQNCLFACFLSHHEPTKISQALDDKSWVEAMQEELLQFKIQKVYVDDIIFGFTNKYLCDEFEQIMHNIFQMSSMEELTFFLGLQVQQKEDGIFINQYKYVGEILKKFGFFNIRSASTLMETPKVLTKDEDGEDVNVHLYRSMIGSLMYFTSLRPDIMFSVCACSRFQVQPKVSYLYAVKGILNISKVPAWTGNPQQEVFNFLMMDYGYNFMQTKIHVDNESAIFVIKNPVYHSKTKDIKIRHYFIRDFYEKRPIKMVKIHTYNNVADLLTKAYDVGDEAVHKEFGDRMERAATTASSLEAEQDIEFCDKHNMVAYLEKSKGSEGFHQIIDFLFASYIKYAPTESPTIYASLIEQFWQIAALSTIKEDVMAITATIDRKVKVLITEASIRRHLKLEDSKGLSTLLTEEIFEQLALMQRRKSSTASRLVSTADVNTTSEMVSTVGVKARDKESVERQSTEKEKGKKNDDSSRPTRKKTLSRKRAGGNDSEDSMKKQKLEDDTDKTDLKAYLDIVPADEFVMEVESLATKYPIVDWKIHVLTEHFMYSQIIKADGSSKNYKIFSEMLDDFDRQDVMDLHRLVEERYTTTSPEGYDLMLWGDLKTLFEPDEENEIWKNQHEYNLIS